MAQQVSVKNIVATIHLDKSQLDLKDLSRKLRNAEYKPKRYQALIVRLTQPSATALVFSSGKIVIMGATSEYDAELAAKRCTETVSKKVTGKKHEITGSNFAIHNVVASAGVDFKINLEDFYNNNMHFSHYEPERFPGLTFRMKEPDVVLLIFHSGKVVLTKGKKRQDVFDAFEKIRPMLARFKQT
eukprot:m.16638 g.16638  ORF g.16638 m.16638 type:complete len:186 (-) comp7152_c0_seq2:107-664(-)